MIDRELVLKLAALSRLDLSDAEVDEIQPKLGMMLELVDQLKAQGSGTVPNSPEEPVFSFKSRDDKVVQPLGREVALKLAPDACEGHFRVAKIIE